VITYDNTYSLLPVETCNAVDTSVEQCSQTEYYGIDGVPANCGLPGPVKRVTDPNSAATEYRYDAFGRLRRLTRPSDTPEHPTQIARF
jgi:YD repeat-containing protein